MVASALLNGVAKIGTGYFGIIGVGIVLWIGVSIGFGVYIRRVNLVRAIINGVCLLGLMIVHMIPQAQKDTSQQQIVFPAIGIALLVVSLGTVIVVLVKVEYGKWKVRKERARRVQIDRSRDKIMIT